MPFHEVDKLGFPLDPELRRLEDLLEYLAAAWRTDKSEEILAEYQQTFDQLYKLGWDGSVDVQSELPSAFMPKEYLTRRERWRKIE